MRAFRPGSVDDVRSQPEKVFQVEEEAGQVEQAATLLEVDQEVDVAGASASPRATDPNTRTLLAP
jgi:hypothetical protein